ncbi:hypothetical protein SODG_003991 [Sodalis praecaptivus]
MVNGVPGAALMRGSGNRLLRPAIEAAIGYYKVTAGPKANRAEPVMWIGLMVTLNGTVSAGRGRKRFCRTNPVGVDAK